MESAIRITTDTDNIVTLLMDAPGKPVNTCSPQFLAELAHVITAVEQQCPAGVIFASAKTRSFSAGADLFEIAKMSHEQVVEFLTLGQSLFERIARLPMPTIAAINGDCLGGGFELSLACTYRVAAEDSSISIGLPEVKLGLIPAWGGTTRLPRMIGIRRALPILLAGKTMPPRKARRSGLVDETVRAEALLAAAKRIVRSGAPRQVPSWLDRTLVNVPALRHRVLAAAERETFGRTYGNYPAPLRLLDVLRDGYERGFAAGLESERRAIIGLTDGDTGRNLMRIFFLRQSAKKRPAEHLTAKPHDVSRAAVIGGGTMGAGITHALIRAGIPVRLVEVNPPAVAAALGRIKKMLDDDVSAGRIDALAARHAINRVSPTTEWTGLELADLVIEAVLETIEVKRDVFARLDRLTRPTAILASNTSALPIADIAQATLHPERVVGLHFFNPVPKMPLAEIVRAVHSDDASVATAIATAVRLGKTPVVANDATGFIVNRILVPYLAEALAMAGEGVSIREIDDAMKRWGMPMGVFELLDEIGLDVAAHVLASLSAGNPAPANVTATFDRARDSRSLGRKSFRGFYVYSNKRRGSAAPTVNADLTNILSGRATAKTLDPESIQWRLVLPMVNEAAHVLEEGVTDSPDAIDLAMVLGTGLAPFRGGVVHFANAVGAEEIVRQLDEHAAQYGPRFAPAALLRDAARTHRPLGPRTPREPAAATLEQVVHK